MFAMVGIGRAWQWRHLYKTIEFVYITFTSFLGWWGLILFPKMAKLGKRTRNETDSIIIIGACMWVYIDKYWTTYAASVLVISN